MSADIRNTESTESPRAIRIPAGSVTLDGEIHMPPDAEGVVLFAHGSGSSRHSPRNKLTAQQLRKAGLGTVLFDLLTPEEEHDDSARGHLRFNIGLLTQRLVCAAHWIAGEDEARHLRLGFFGSSTGGGAALVAAADLGKGIGAVVSRGGRPDLAGGALRRVKCPTLLIVGERDEEVLELNEEAYGLLDCEKELQIVRGATHLFEEESALDEVGRLAGDWFLEHLGHVTASRFRR
jgi:predicted alpha/beta-hydrolase family hydrolase